jgi:hypothetical protein
MRSLVADWIVKVSANTHLGETLIVNAMAQRTASQKREGEFLMGAISGDFSFLMLHIGMGCQQLNNAHCAIESGVSGRFHQSA